jgi:hypothetical protein
MNTVRIRWLAVVTVSMVLWSLLSPSADAATPGRGIAGKAGRGGAPTLNCSTALRLHDGTFQTGTTVYVYARGIWVNLSDVGFNNMTSSYTVGACAVVLASGTNGGGSHYPYCLFAGCVEDVMAPGWDNVISSVYLR